MVEHSPKKIRFDFEALYSENNDKMKENLAERANFGKKHDLIVKFSDYTLPLNKTTMFVLTCFPHK